MAEKEKVECPLTLQEAATFVREKMSVRDNKVTGEDGVEKITKSYQLPASATTEFYKMCGIPQAVYDQIRASEKTLHMATHQVATDLLIEKIEEQKAAGVTPETLAALDSEIKIRTPHSSHAVRVRAKSVRPKPGGGEPTITIGKSTIQSDYKKTFDADWLAESQARIKAALGE